MYRRPSPPRPRHHRQIVSAPSPADFRNFNIAPERALRPGHRQRDHGELERIADSHLQQLGGDVLSGFQASIAHRCTSVADVQETLGRQELRRRCASHGLFDMKPQLVVSDFGGAHNRISPRPLRAWIAQVWKNSACRHLPAADLVSAKCVLSWWNLAFRQITGRQDHRSRYEVGTLLDRDRADPRAPSCLNGNTSHLEHDNAPPATVSSAWLSR